MLINFATLLRQLMESENILLKQLYEKLQSSSSDVSYSSLSTYKNENAVPPFNKAKEILNVFEYPISDKGLEEILEYSKQQIRLQHEDEDKYIQRSIKIMPNNLDESMSASTMELLIKNRTKDLFGLNGNFNQYINYLIDQDLISHGYVQTTNKSGENS